MLEGYNAKQTEAIIKNILKYHNDKYVCIRKLKKEEKDIIINILKKIVNDRLKSYELETLGIQPKYI